MRSAPTRPFRSHAATVAFLFVVVSLAALVVVPVAVERRVARLRARGEMVTDPARTHVRDIELALARGMSALRGYALTGETVFLDRYAASVARERSAVLALRPLAAILGPQVAARLSRLQLRAERWHARVRTDPLLRGTGSGSSRAPVDGGAAARIPGPGQPGLYESVLEATADLDRAILAEAQRHRDAIEAEERRGLRLTMGLVLVAFASAAAVAWLSHRTRLFAAEAERRRNEAAEAAEASRRAVAERNRFIHGVTHDLRNPLGAADLYASLLETDAEPLSPRHVPWVGGLRRSLRGALSILDDLLNLARAESGDLVVRWAPVDLREVVWEAAEDHPNRDGLPGPVLDVVAPDAPLVVSTDRERVRQIVDNLVSNAIKYTPSGGRVTLGLSAAEAGEGPPGGPWLRTWVADSGPGIPAAERERIFLDFQRLHGSSVAGFGLGLAISRRIARLLGGEVTLESEEGRGSVFSLWLPVRPAGLPASPEAGEPAAAAER